MESEDPVLDFIRRLCGGAGARIGLPCLWGMGIWDLGEREWRCFPGNALRTRECRGGWKRKKRGDKGNGKGPTRDRGREAGPRS